MLISEIVAAVASSRQIHNIAGGRATLINVPASNPMWLKLWRFFAAIPLSIPEAPAQALNLSESINYFCLTKSRLFFASIAQGESGSFAR